MNCASCSKKKSETAEPMLDTHKKVKWYVAGLPIQSVPKIASLALHLHARMRQLGVIRDKQAFSAAEGARKEYFFCGPSPGMFLFILNDLWNIPWFRLLTARFRTRLRTDKASCGNICQLWYRVMRPNFDHTQDSTVQEIKAVLHREKLTTHL